MQAALQIRNSIDEGHYSEAHASLDELLSIGPNNIEALKLKSILYAHEGKFSEEDRIWEKILSIDREDPDAIYFFLRRSLEDREAFYFSDPLPNGGRRFFAHPKALINSAFFGLFGCVLFLFFSSLARQYYFFATPVVTSLTFFVFVLAPWFSIIYYYFAGLKEVELTQDGLSFATRLSRVFYRWDEIQSLSIEHVASPMMMSLTLVLLPRSEDLPGVEVDLARETSAIRARNLFVAEIRRFFGEPGYSVRRPEIPPTKKLIRF